MEARISAALARCGRARSEITLVAVSKKFSASAIESAYACGCRHFGENYVAEFAEKRKELPELPDARFHLIGHLQSNKARVACEIFHSIQTVDSVKLLQRIDGIAKERAARINLMLEVKLAEEENKAGCAPSDIPALMQAAAHCSHASLDGLMTIPPWSEDAEASRPYFQELAALARQYGLPRISMGMSNDLEVALEEGATDIRIGTALFGQRPKPVAAVSNL